MICDLRTEPLIPVHTTSADGGGPGELRHVGLREVLVHAHDYTDLAITIPPAAAGMLRVLYTIAARITGLDRVRTQPEFEQKRAALAARGGFDPTDVDSYLYRPDLDHRWDLFDPRWPWLQDPRLTEQAELKRVNALVATRPGDNSPIWWQHTWDQHAPAVSTVEALQWLLAHYWYGSGGAGGVREVGSVRDQYMSAGPLRGTVSFYPLGRNLFETVVAGIPSPATATGAGVDAASWEVAERPDPTSQPPEATWPAGLLTGQSRHAVLLIPDPTGTCVEGCYLTWAYKKRHLPIKDPYTIQDRHNGETWQPRAADATRALWRDVDALLADQVDHHRPAVLTGTLTLPDTWQPHLRVRVYGWDQDRKATDRMMFTATTPALLRWMAENDPEAAEGAAQVHTAAEDIAGELGKRLRIAYRSLSTGSPGPAKNNDVPWVAPAEASYWPNAEALFWHLLDQRHFTEPYWQFWPVAMNAVDAATRHVGHHPPVARELAKAIHSLRNFVAKKNPRKKETDAT
jgi:CRISPR system Cascade subunit CasA